VIKIADSDLLYLKILTTWRQCPQLKIIRVDMSIYFGSINHIQKKIEKISDGQNIHHILIVASGINFIDLSGMETLASEHNRLKRKGGGLYFVGLKAPVYQFLAQAHFFEKISRINFFDSKSVAIRAIYRRLERDICTQCDAKIFNECR
jgi:SulP family sulfate permease